MSEAVDTVKTEDMPPLDEDAGVVQKEEKYDVVPDESEPRSRTCQIVEGKREKKVVQRLDMQMCKPKEKAKIESTGKGVKLGDIARINHCIGKLKAPLLKPLHKIVYDRPGAASTLRKNLRLFNGFTFDVDSDPYSKKMSKVIRLPKTQLKTICQTLDLERSGKQSVLAERIMTFLLCPTNSGKPVLKKKKRKTTKDVKGDKSSSKSKKPQKKAEGGKSRAIVTDSSSDDDDDDNDDAEENNKRTEKSTAVSQKCNNSESQSSDKGEDDEDDDNEEDGEEEQDDAPEEDSEEEKKSPRKKKSPAKKATKKSEQKSEKLTTDDSDQSSKEEKTVKKTTKKPAAKRKAPVKPIPKTKKADSSSNRGKKTASKSKCEDSDSSDDNQPLIKMIKKPPTDDELKATIQDLLKDANLEEVTMNQLCRQVFDKYPDFDLTTRKEFIKDTVKSNILKGRN